MHGHPFPTLRDLSAIYKRHEGCLSMCLKLTGVGKISFSVFKIYLCKVNVQENLL